MDAHYWEAIGDRYEQEIFDSALADARRIIRRRLDELSAPRGVACDFGCGVGHYLPLLAPRFRSVYGVDFAESLLVHARRRGARFDNVTVLRGDLARSRGRLAIPDAKVGVCANVLISGDARVRRSILRTVRRHLARSGHLLLLLPSLESALFANQRLVEWNRRLGCSHEEALGSGIAPTARGARELLEGAVRIENVPTKHFLEEEAIVLLESEGFSVKTIDKVEYSWHTEFDDPPRWMGRPGPWDWLVLAQIQPGSLGRASSGALPQ